MKHWLAIGGGVVVLGVSAAIWHPAAPQAPSAAAASEAPAGIPRRMHHQRLPSPSTDSVVYVVGAVHSAGLYHVSPAARVADAVREAGGLRSDADPEGVNLAAHVQDGDEILVPVLGQSIVKVRARVKARKSKAPAQQVDLNSADAALLSTLPGIGATLAARIVAVRERDGAYTSLDQLLDVAGMTQSRLDRVASYLRI